MSSDKILIESLVELKREIPHLNPVGYSYREFSQESNNIQQAQANTIVKLLVKINNRLEDLDNRLNTLENNFQIFRKKENYHSYTLYLLCYQKYYNTLRVYQSSILS